MTNVIFGSGLVGLIAKKLLVGNWSIVPFGRSRYYSFNPPLADNFITRDAEIDNAVADLCNGDQPDVYQYRRYYSVNGSLVKEYDETLTTTWLNKIFGGETSINGTAAFSSVPREVPRQSLPYLRTRLIMQVYKIRANRLYESLQAEYQSLLMAEAANGQITEIGPHYFVRNGIRVDFDNAISTIPLPILMKLIGRDIEFVAKPEYYILLKTDKIDLEGANQAWVVDQLFDFYKVTMVMPQHYMFYCINEIQRPGSYLLPIVGPADIIDGTMIRDSIPTGQIPDLSWLDEYGIFCIGSQAQNDWCADIGSNILRLVRYAARGYK